MESYMSVYMGYYFLVALYVLLIYFIIRSIGIITRKLNIKISMFDGLSDSYLLILGFSYIGMTLGLLTGLSLNPVVQAVIPSLLTFMTGLTAYIFINKETEQNTTKYEAQQKNQKMAVTALIFVSVLLMYGLEIGSKIRAKSELESKRIEQIYTKDLERYKYELLRYEKDLELQYLKDLKKNGLDSPATSR
jgi:hypothetical protein